MPAGLVHRHRSLDHRDHRAAHAGGHRENGSLHRGDGITGQNLQAAPALFGGLDDDVAALEVNRLAAPGGGHEQLRSLVDIHDRSVGEPQHRMGSRAGADRLPFADGGACFETHSRFAARPGGTGRRRRKRPWPARRLDPSWRRWRRVRDRGPRRALRPPRPGLPTAPTGKRTRRGMATTVLSPFISAIRARQPGQRLRWSSTRMRRLPPSSLPR